MAEHPDCAARSAVCRVIGAGCVIAQVSDPHLTSPAPGGWGRLGPKRLLSYLSWRRKRRFRHRADVLAAVMADLRASRPDHVLVTGDLTHLGLPGECREALDWLAGIGAPAAVSVVPGNHDALVADDWSATAGRWRAFFESDPDLLPGRDRAVPNGDEVSRDAAFPSLRRCGRVALIGLNTAVPTPPLFASGRVGAAQLERLAAALEALGAAGWFRLVYLHHSPLADGHTWRKRLRDAGALFHVLQTGGAELVVHGHGHHEAQATVITRAGPTLVVGAPSASLGGAYVGGWNRYVIAPGADGWLVDIEYRRHGDGGMALVDSSRYLLPRRVALPIDGP